jgi:pilus assembly protein Flp/PilA
MRFASTELALAAALGPVCGLPPANVEEVGIGPPTRLVRAPGSVKLKGEPMTMLFKAVARFVREEDGPTAVEYAVMLALIIVVCITAITTLGTNANQSFSNTSLNIAAGNASGGS